MKWFAGSIVWQGTAYDAINEAIITLPDGERVTIRRESNQSMVKVGGGGPLFLGSEKYILCQPEGESQFDSFDDLMMIGLKQPKLEKERDFN